jgi:hypothetical protein
LDDPARLLADQAQHVSAHLEALPPDRILSGSVALQAKRGIVREERAYGCEAAAAERRAVRSFDWTGGNVSARLRRTTE